MLCGRPRDLPVTNPSLASRGSDGYRWPRRPPDYRQGRRGSGATSLPPMLVGPLLWPCIQGRPPWRPRGARNGSLFDISGGRRSFTCSEGARARGLRPRPPRPIAVADSTRGAVRAHRGQGAGSAAAAIGRASENGPQD